MPSELWCKCLSDLGYHQRDILIHPLLLDPGRLKKKVFKEHIFRVKETVQSNKSVHGGMGPSFQDNPHHTDPLHNTQHNYKCLSCMFFFFNKKELTLVLCGSAFQVLQGVNDITFILSLNYSIMIGVH